ncbi:glycosyltransferase [Rhodococcus sp. BP-316]|uniref:glycosyltransferase n=1 Tax=Rhodococcus sp. BP-316 TaxID=2739445 RepID=UPI001C9AF100|nr:glycosyltransferase [Rhodococcus sp. BP-316]MBY6681896.1 glycosyltransferase [Rhodococcus sp. BP-316]
MKIVHVSEAFGGGLRSAIVNYVRGADAHEHHLFVRTRVGHETFDVPETATVQTFDGDLMAFLRDARRLILDNDFDIVHLHSSYAGLLRAMLPKGTRIVYSPHCYAMEEGHPPAKRLTYWAVERFLAGREQMLMAVSPRELAIGHDLRPSMPSREVPNTATPMSLVVERPPASDRPLVAMLGRIADQKDPRFFAEVAEVVGPSCEFVWIGSGDEGRECLERAGVRITGWIEPTEVRRLVQTASLYLHTAAWEGAPLSTLEAAEMGCPILSRSIPSMVSLNYPLAGTTPVEMAIAVRRFFADLDYQELVRAQSVEVAKSFDFALMAGRLTEAYDFARSRLGNTANVAGDRGTRDGILTA